MFGIFQFVALHMDCRSLGRIAVGLAYTYVGLVLFLTGANVGFMPAGNYLGQVLAGQSFRWIIIPIGMLIGYFIVKAEPAVYVLNKQVEEVTDGAISAKAMAQPSRQVFPSRWALHGAGAHRRFHPVVPRAGLCVCHRHLLCGAKAVHRHCI